MQLHTGRPAEARSPREDAVYDTLDRLGIAYRRVDHEAAKTMEDCEAVDKVLGVRMCKNLFLCNRQQTEFYLLLMPGDKPFKTKFLSAQLGCSRLSFADDGHMKDYLQTIPGSVSVLELLFDKEHHVKLVIDRDLLKCEFIGAHPGISTSSLKLKRDDILRYAAAVNHEPTLIDLPDPRTMEE